MSEKMTCPGCNARTSGVMAAFCRDEPCPNCGLSAAAAGEIIVIREKRADAELKERLRDEITARSAAERKARSAQWRLEAVAEAVAEALNAAEPDWLHDGNHG